MSDILNGISIDETMKMIERINEITNYDFTLTPEKYIKLKDYSDNKSKFKDLDSDSAEFMTNMALFYKISKDFIEVFVEDADFKASDCLTFCNLKLTPIYEIDHSTKQFDIAPNQPKVEPCFTNYFLNISKEIFSLSLCSSMLRNTLVFKYGDDFVNTEVLENDSEMLTEYISNIKILQEITEYLKVTCTDVMKYIKEDRKTSV